MKSTLFIAGITATLAGCTLMRPADLLEFGRTSAVVAKVQATPAKLAQCLTEHLERVEHKVGGTGSLTPARPVIKRLSLNDGGIELRSSFHQMLFVTQVTPNREGLNVATWSNPLFGVTAYEEVVPTLVKRCEASLRPASLPARSAAAARP